MDYLIGDTIRLKATMKNLFGVEEAVADLTVGVYKLDGTALFSTGEPILTGGTTAQYYYDWLIPITLTANTNLIAVWSWGSIHKKKMTFSVITVLS